MESDFTYATNELKLVANYPTSARVLRTLYTARNHLFGELTSFTVTNGKKEKAYSNKERIIFPSRSQPTFECQPAFKTSI